MLKVSGFRFLPDDLPFPDGMCSMRHHCLTASCLTAMCLAGCATSPDEFQPTIAGDTGPWDVAVNSDALGNFWINFGPYRTDWINSWRGKTNSETGIQQAGFKTKGKPFVFELVAPSGQVLHVARGIQRGDKIIKTGQVKIPLAASWTDIGLITRDSQPLAEFATKWTKNDLLGSTRSKEQTLTVGSTPVVIETRTEKPSTIGAYEQIVGQDYFWEGAKVASVEISPDYRVWVDESADLDVQHAVVAHAASLVAEQTEDAKQAAASQLYFRP